MRREVLVDAGPLAGLAAGPRHGVPIEVRAGQQAREQPLALGPGAPPVVAQDLQQPLREHRVAVLGALALLDADDHARRVDVARAQADGFGDAQARRVAGGQHGAIGAGGDGVEEADGLLGAGHDRQGARLLGGGQDFADVPVPAQGDSVEEAQGGDGDADRAGSEPLLGGEKELVVADLLGAEPFRGLLEVVGEARHLVEVALLRAARQVADLHKIGTFRFHAEWEPHENGNLCPVTRCAARA